jgi:hypothetical protein
MISVAQGQDQKQFGNSMIKSLTTAVLARAFLPSPADIKSCMQFLDLGIKFQIMLYEWSSTLFWTAIFEVSLFLSFQVLFFVSPGRMAGLYFHIAHLPRGALGLILVKTMPNSHDMLTEIRIPQNEKIPFSKIAEKAIIGAGTCVAQFSTKCQKLLIAYASVTALTLLLDLISFFRCLKAYQSTTWNDAFA